MLLLRNWALARPFLGRSIPRSKFSFTEVIIFEDLRAGEMAGGKGACHEVDNLSLVSPSTHGRRKELT